MNKVKTIEVKYTVCDWCEKEIDDKDKEVVYFFDDFPTLSFHKNPCLRQAAATGVKLNKKTL